MIHLCVLCSNFSLFCIVISLCFVWSFLLHVCHLIFLLRILTRSVAVAVKVDHIAYNVDFSCLIICSFKLKSAFHSFWLLFRCMNKVEIIKIRIGSV